MAKQESFENAKKSLKTASFKEATKKANAVNLAVEFAKREVFVEKPGAEK